jgi:5'-nucleotidase/UDP-sugar diphosphatase
LLVTVIFAFVYWSGREDEVNEAGRRAGAHRRMGLVSLPAQAYEKDKTYKITILHTNDHHGHFWRSEYGEYGLSAQKTLVDGIRKEVAAQGGSVLLLSGGDINTGVPESDLQDAEPDFRGMNLIGYDAMAVGNHEFDNPLTVLRQQEKWAKFPFLSANIYQKSTGERLFKPWALFKRQDLKIAVIGLTTDDTAKIGNPSSLPISNSANRQTKRSW